MPTLHAGELNMLSVLNQYTYFHVFKVQFLKKYVRTFPNTIDCLGFYSLSKRLSKKLIIYYIIITLYITLVDILLFL